MELSDLMGLSMKKEKDNSDVDDFIDDGSSESDAANDSDSEEENLPSDGDKAGTGNARAVTRTVYDDGMSDSWHTSDEEDDISE